MKFEVGKRWLVFAALTCAILWFSGNMQNFVQFFKGRTPAELMDFRVYYTAGLVVRESGENRLYSYRKAATPNESESDSIVNPQLDSPDPNSVFARVADRSTKVGMQYLYPPSFALLVSPLTHLSLQQAGGVWYVLSHLLIWCCILLTLKMIHEDSLLVVISSGLLLLITESIFPMKDLLWGGNVGALMLFFCVLGIFLQVRNRPVASAFFITLAVFIKLTPIVFVPLMIVRRQGKWVTAFFGWSLLIAAISVWQLGWSNHYDFFTNVMPAMADGIPNHNNRSLLSLFQFIEVGKVQTVEDFENGAASFAKHSVIPFKIVAAVSLLAFLYFLWRGCKDSSSLIRELFALLLLSLILSPVSWRHSYILAIAPLVYIWAHPSSQKWSVFDLSLLTFATICLFTVFPDYAMRVFTPFPFQLLMVSAMPIGVIVGIFLLFRIPQSEVAAFGDNNGREGFGKQIPEDKKKNTGEEQSLLRPCPYRALFNWLRVSGKRGEPFLFGLAGREVAEKRAVPAPDKR